MSEWLNLIVRWVHVFAGILWIGQTYFFTWLDGRLTEEEKSARGQKNPTTPQIWMVHSGGFYVVEKQKGAELLPRRLHWFRWEAALTWLSGMALLIIVYYLGGLMVDDTVARISLGQAVGFGVGLLVGAWFLYDFLVQSPLGSHERLLAVVGFFLLVGVSLGLTHVFSGRAAYIHVGALLGTIMTANVWLRILPAQRQMLARARQGQPLDPILSGRAKLNQAQYLPGGTCGLHHGEQPLSYRDVRQPVQLAHSGSAGAGGLGRSKTAPASLKLKGQRVKASKSHMAWERAARWNNVGVLRRALG
jgi:uncharacterized membrane protein